jgi:hypothetical protein
MRSLRLVTQAGNQPRASSAGPCAGLEARSDAGFEALIEFLNSTSLS